MRLADVVLRRGHLSDRTLADVCLNAGRPAHLDRCDLCAERAVAYGRWLDDVRTTGVHAADAVFPPERLAAQQAQILRRLEQLDHPARVIAFPGQSRYYGQADMVRARIAPAWVGFAAAAGLLLGMVGGQITARLTPPSTGTRDAMVALVADLPSREQSARVADADATLVDSQLGWPQVLALEAIDQLTPHSVDNVRLVTATRTGR